MSLHSATTSHHGATIHEASTKVHAIHPSGLPLTRDPQAGQGSFGFPLGLRTLPLPATHAKGGARHRAHARDYTTDITSALLTASPLAKCDIVSQRHVSASGIRVFDACKLLQLATPTFHPRLPHLSRSPHRSPTPRRRLTSTPTRHCPRSLTQLKPGTPHPTPPHRASGPAGRPERMHRSSPRSIGVACPVRPAR
jgi:hypothetical protein